MRLYGLTTPMEIALLAKDSGMPLREITDEEYLWTRKGLAYKDRVVELPTFGKVLDWLMDKCFILMPTMQIDGTYGWVIETWGETKTSEKGYDCPRDAMIDAIKLTLKWIGNGDKR